MTTLTERQMHDLAGRLTRLRAVASEQDKAGDDAHEANRRWNAARERYRGEWVEIVRAYGEQNAPLWLESQRGPKPKIEPTR